MTSVERPPAPAAPPVVLAEARWPEPGDALPPDVPGFLHSFNPLAAAVADRCLARRHPVRPVPAEVGVRTALVLLSRDGDRASAERVAAAVAAGERVGPLYFFQSVPNSVAGYVAARWGLRGPVVCLSPAGNPRAAALAEADLLLRDGDADEALLVLVGPGDDEATALLVRPAEDPIRQGEHT